MLLRPESVGPIILLQPMCQSVRWKNGAFGVRQLPFASRVLLCMLPNRSEPLTLLVSKHTYLPRLKVLNEISCVMCLSLCLVYSMSQHIFVLSLTYPPKHETVSKLLFLLPGPPLLGQGLIRSLVIILAAGNQEKKIQRDSIDTGLKTDRKQGLE